MSLIEWRYSKGQANSSIISEVELYFNVSLPEHYKKIVSQFNGARPRPNTFKLINGREVKLRSFLPIGREHIDNIMAINTRLGDQLPESYIAFANDDFGNYFCFDNENKVVFWNHENGDFTLFQDDLLAFLLN